MQFTRWKNFFFPSKKVNYVALIKRQAHWSTGAESTIWLFTINTSLEPCCNSGTLLEMDVGKECGAEHTHVKAQVLLRLCWKPSSFPAKRERVQSQVQTCVSAQQRRSGSAESGWSCAGISWAHGAPAALPTAGSTQCTRASCPCALLWNNQCNSG